LTVLTINLRIPRFKVVGIIITRSIKHWTMCLGKTLYCSIRIWTNTQIFELLLKHCCDHHPIEIVLLTFHYTILKFPLVGLVCLEFYRLYFNCYREKTKIFGLSPSTYNRQPFNIDTAFHYQCGLFYILLGLCLDFMLFYFNCYDGKSRNIWLLTINFCDRQPFSIDVAFHYISMNGFVYY
jgi:hypothetical protein